MILYHSPGACSLVPHIALEESATEFEPRRVTLAKGEHHSPEFLEINPHGRVPALEVEGRVITENVAILNFIAARTGADGTVPLDEPLAAARCNELLGWFASTVHVAFAQIWRPERFTSDEAVHPALVDGGREALRSQFAEIESLCAGDWLVGDRFTAADSYAVTFFRWGRRIGLPMEGYDRWSQLVGRVIERPAVRTVLEREGLDASEFRLPS